MLSLCCYHTCYHYPPRSGSLLHSVITRLGLGLMTLTALFILLGLQYKMYLLLVVFVVKIDKKKPTLRNLNGTPRQHLLTKRPLNPPPIGGKVEPPEGKTI